MKNVPIERYLILYIPWVLAMLFQSVPTASYLVAWVGSFFIFFVVYTGKIKPLPTDHSIPEQIMRPIFIVQIIFVGYMACSSIFYFLNLYGYNNFQKTNEYLLIDQNQLALIAKCQRYYILGHAALATGMLVFMKYPAPSGYYIKKEKLANMVMIMALIAFPVSLFFLIVPGLSQFYFQLNSLSFIAGTLALAFAIPLQKMWNTIICLLLYCFNFYQGVISGYKEPIIISVMVLGIFLYPNYKKIVLTVFVPALLLLFVVLPKFATTFRQNAWSGETETDEATALALDAALNDNSANDETNWDFLVYRLSEISMFTIYLQSTPNTIDYYGPQLLQQSAIVLVPRVFWPGKPSTEDLVMVRVYDAGAVSRNSKVSAKPAYIVDTYLSAGTLGVFIGLFLYGAIASAISVKAEKLFGGYTLGTALIFTGLFQIFWRGLSFEFLINSVFWSYVSMLLIQKVLIATSVLKKNN
ncbi:exosortase Y-associated Wzy-like protein [Mucilaginibacter sp. McL0603]|uniref:exosortase Y-associated Wzy-like protein n=1 Tax=Mucilaginibacter sp. McL0603 TaxID=3415670 RepID=UPI003CE93A0C